jgi:hypothetical protein
MFEVHGGALPELLIIRSNSPNGIDDLGNDLCYLCIFQRWGLFIVTVAVLPIAKSFLTIRFPW